MAKKYGVTRTIINDITRDNSWTDITKDLDFVKTRKMGNGLDWSKTKLTPEMVKEIKVKLAEGLSNLTIGRVYGVSEAAIYLIKKGKNWKHITID